MQPMSHPGGHPPFGPGPADADSGDAKKSKKNKAKKQKRSGGTSPGRRNAIIALLLAVLVGVAVFSFQGDPVSQTYVLRAQVNINPMEQVQEGMLEAVALPDEAIEPGAISAATAAEVLEIAAGSGDDASAIIGAFPQFPIREGQQISPEMFAGDARIPISLDAGERLVSIAADASAAVAGSLKAGDRVDVVTVDTGSDIAGLVAADVEIVAVRAPANLIDSVASRQAAEDGRELAPEDIMPRRPLPGVYIVRADLETAALLSIADQTTPLYLLYRAPDAETGAIGRVSLAVALCETGISGEAAAWIDENGYVAPELPEPVEGEEAELPADGEAPHDPVALFDEVNEVLTCRTALFENDISGGTWNDEDDAIGGDDVDFNVVDETDRSSDVG